MATKDHIIHDKGSEETSAVPNTDGMHYVDVSPQELHQRTFEKFRALKGKVHLNLDIDELRGRTRR